MRRYCPIPPVSVRLFCARFGRSSNGRTADSGSAYRRSNPCLPVQLTETGYCVATVSPLSAFQQFRLLCLNDNLIIRRRHPVALVRRPVEVVSKLLTDISSPTYRRIGGKI